MAGKAGEPGALPTIGRNGTNNGFFVHSRALWWQNEDTALLPDLVDRRSFNDLLMNVEPRRSRPRRRCIDSMPPGFTVELVAAEPLVQSPIAFAWGADGKLWVVEMGDYPLGIDGKGKPGGGSGSWKTRRGRQVRQGDGLSRRPRLSDRRDAVAQGRPRHLCAGYLLRRGHEGHGKADLSRRSSPASAKATSSTGSTASCWASTAGSTAPTATAGVVTSAQDGRDRRLTSAAAISGFGPIPASSTQAARPSMAGTATTGATGSATTTTGRCGTSSWPTTTSAATRYVAPPDPRASSRDAEAAQVYPISRTLPRFNDPKAANHVTSANSPIVYRDDLFGPSLSSPPA